MILKEGLKEGLKESLNEGLKEKEKKREYKRGKAATKATEQELPADKGEGTRTLRMAMMRWKNLESTAALSFPRDDEEEEEDPSASLAKNTLFELAFRRWGRNGERQNRKK